MYKLLFLFLLCGFVSNAQIQFWTKDEIIDKQFEPARKEIKINQAYNFITSEYWQVTDSTDYSEIFEYDKEGRKIVYKKYKTDWVKNKKYFMNIDSVFYNEKGILTEMRRYSPQSDGSYYSLTWAAKSVLNTKGQIERINYYSGYQASELSSYDVFAYNTMGKPVNIISYNADKKKENEWKIEYDSKGHISKVRSVNSFGFIDYVMKYNASGQLTNYTELYDGKDKNSEAKYLYDNDKRLVRRDYITSTSYTDTTGYWYNGNDKVYYRTYLKYPRGSSSQPDFAHEFRVYMFRRRD